MQIVKAPWGAHTIQNKISGTTRTCSEIVCNGWFKEGSNRTPKMWLFYYHFILTAQVRIISPKGHVYKMSENSYPQLVCLTKNNGLHLSGGLRVPLWCQDRAVNEEQKTTLKKLHRKLPTGCCEVSIWPIHPRVEEECQSMQANSATKGIY